MALVMRAMVCTYTDACVLLFEVDHICAKLILEYVRLNYLNKYLAHRVEPLLSR